MRNGLDRGVAAEPSVSWFHPPGQHPHMNLPISSYKVSDEPRPHMNMADNSTQWICMFNSHKIIASAIHND